MSSTDSDVMALIHPSNIVVAGPTGCGKTYWVSRLLSSKMLDPWPQRIVVVYSEWQSAYEKWRRQYPKIEFVKADRDIAEDDDGDVDMLSRIYDSFRPEICNLLILDDQMREAGSKGVVQDLFTKGSHHRNLTILFLIQNLYSKGASMRTINLNSQYLVLFKNKRDKSQLRILGQQMFPGCSQFPVQVLEDVCEHNPRGYILFDMMPETREDLQVRTRIFPGEDTVFYVPTPTLARGIKGRRGAGVGKANNNNNSKCPFAKSTTLLFQSCGH